MKSRELNHKFVEVMPAKIEELTLYIAMDFATAVHKCCCGCGVDVVTPFSPTDWNITYDGVSVSLSPSIGNWSFKCQSHYWISRSTIKWADHWMPEQIIACRAADRRAKGVFYEQKTLEPKPVPAPEHSSLLSSIRRWLFG